MIRVGFTFIIKDGTRKEFREPIGMSLLDVAHKHDIDLEGKFNIFSFLNKEAFVIIKLFIFLFNIFIHIFIYIFIYIHKLLI